jgi:hypothetical protein
MSVPLGLNQVPQKLLDPAKWMEIRAFASNDLIALTYLNAPYPDQDDPTDFFWGRDGSSKQTVRCYELGRDLLGQSRRQLIEGKLVATGSRPDGTREVIKPIEWANLWPMFATNRATGPNQSFDEVEILESTALETPDQRMLLGCMSWLGVQSPTVLSQKKSTLLHLARIEIGATLTHSTFNAAYKAVLGRSRGRPSK